ncbi:MAG: serine-type D-Ala-D-Ala carboxypeptidase [Gammaproteobacteria bacterium]|nr:MAG: serine-type D-Ala-D-Ala carboxypeptidase [Gammaproteobacteria bacterium]
MRTKALRLSLNQRAAAASLLMLFSLGQTLAVSASALIPAPPKLAAKSYVLMDADTGKIIVQKNAHKELPPASLTKIMTGYVASHELTNGNISFDDSVRVSVKAWKTGGSRMFLKEGTYVDVENLLRGVIIQSGNDASVALSEHIAGSEDAFADLMNRHADRLSMHNTHYMNATGLPSSNHYTTAADLAILAQASIRDFPQHYSIYSEKEFTYNNIKQSNRNKLLWRDPTVDGLKTGHTEAAGYCLVASAINKGMRLISVVMGTKSPAARAQESQKLLTYGFRFYETHTLSKANEAIKESKVWMGEQDTIELGVNQEFKATIPRGQLDNISTTVSIDPIIKAPITKGTRYGTVTLALEGELLAELPLVALHDLDTGSLFKRVVDYLILLVQSFFK